MPRQAAEVHQDSFAWRRPSKRRTSSTRRAGRPYAAMEKRTELYGNGDYRRHQGAGKGTACRRTPSTRTGNAPRRLMALDQGRQGPLPALPAGGHHRRQLRGRAKSRPRSSTATATPLQAGQLQALHHRGDDLPEQGRDPVRSDVARSNAGDQARPIRVICRTAVLG